MATEPVLAASPIRRRDVADGRCRRAKPRSDAALGAGPLPRLPDAHAVAIEPEYQCHSCGREFAAGLVRVPRAWGDGGEEMAAAAWLELPYPEAAVVEEQTLEEQIAAQAPQSAGTAARARRLLLRPRRGDPRARGAAGPPRRRLDRRARRPQHAGDVAVGQRWGMPLRMAIDAGAVHPRNRRSSAPATSTRPSSPYLEATGIDDDVDRALAGCDRVYVAFDCDVLRPGELAVFMPEPGGLDRRARPRRCSVASSRRCTLAGLGLTGLRDEADPMVVARLVAAAGL